MTDQASAPPTSRYRLPVVVALLALAGFTAALLLTRAHADPADLAPTQAAPAAARTLLPGVVPASGEPDLPSLLTMHPAPGTAVQAPGPFDDRLHFTDLAFDGTRVTATVAITSDVSDILEFQAVACFYDTDGHLIGTHRFTHHHTEESTAGHTGPPDELEQVTIPVPPELTGRAASAALAVPVLVNE